MSALILSALLAAAPSADECVAANAQGQQDRNAQRLLAAKSSFDTCAQDECPPQIRDQCIEALRSLAKDTPSLVITARVDGSAAAHATVSLDGQPWLNSLDAMPVQVDPGQHELAIDVGGLKQSQHHLISIGQQERAVVFELKTPKHAPSIDGPVALTISTAAAFAIAASFGIAGRVSLVNVATSPCGATRTCDPSSIIGVRSMYLVADIFLVLGVVSAALGAWRWWLYLH